VLQELHHAELADGVVEREVLSRVIIPPKGFLVLRSKVEDEFEREMVDSGAKLESPIRKGLAVVPRKSHSKPTFEQLSQRLSMTNSRLRWLHQLFESHLVGDHDGQETYCGYPEKPASISKLHMRNLMMEVKPTITEAEFEARFARIDEDCSGHIEFDEFVVWLREEEVKVEMRGTRKSFEELAECYSVTPEVIRYLHNHFESMINDGEDGYPQKPLPIATSDAFTLIQQLTPNETWEHFNAHVYVVDTTGKKSLDFDEFLEVLDFDQLPPELL
jgi:Ca2+-binding EF-hand superfamily protein